MATVIVGRHDRFKDARLSEEAFERRVAFVSARLGPKCGFHVRVERQGAECRPIDYEVEDAGPAQVLKIRAAMTGLGL